MNTDDAYPHPPSPPATRPVRHTPKLQSVMHGASAALSSPLRLSCPARAVATASTASVRAGALRIARPPVGRAPPASVAVLAPVGFECQGATQTFRTVCALCYAAVRQPPRPLGCL